MAKLVSEPSVTPAFGWLERLWGASARINGTRYKASDMLTALLFLLPSLLVFGVFVYYALGFNVYLSTTSWNLLSEEVRSVGLGNYVRLLRDDTFWIALRNTIYFSGGTLAFSMSLGLLLALMLNEKLPARPLFRTIFFTPYITTTSAVALLWIWIFDPNFGLLNGALGVIGIDGPNWLTSQTWAMPALILMNVWKMTGYTMVIYLAGLTSIPRDLVEAARIDGAGRFAMFWRIVLPLLSPTTFFIMVTLLLSSFQVFDQVAIMTQGGPVEATKVLNFYIWEQAFVNFRAGFAAAIAIVFFGLLLVLTGTQLWLSRRWVHYQ